MIPIDEGLEQAWAELKKDKPNHTVLAFNFIRAAIFDEGYGAHFEKLDNDLLGIKEFSDSELEAFVHSLAQ